MNDETKRNEGMSAFIGERLIGRNRLVLAKEHLVLPDIALQACEGLRLDIKEALHYLSAFRKISVMADQTGDGTGRMRPVSILGFRMGTVGLVERRMADGEAWQTVRHALYLTSQGFVFEPEDATFRSAIYEAHLTTTTMRQMLAGGHVTFLGRDRDASAQEIVGEWAPYCSPFFFYEPGESERLGVGTVPKTASKTTPETPRMVPAVSMEPFFNIYTRFALVTLLHEIQSQAGMEGINRFLYRLYAMLVFAPKNRFLPGQQSLDQAAAESANPPYLSQSGRVLDPADLQMLADAVDSATGATPGVWPTYGGQVCTYREFCLKDPFFAGLMQDILEQGNVQKEQDANDRERRARDANVARGARILSAVTGKSPQELGITGGNLTLLERARRMRMLLDLTETIRNHPVFSGEEAQKRRKEFYGNLKEREGRDIAEVLSSREDVASFLQRLQDAQTAEGRRLSSIWEREGPKGLGASLKERVRGRIGDSGTGAGRPR